MTRILNHLTVQDVGLQHGEEYAVPGSYCQLEEEGGHQVETGEGGLRDSHGLQGYEDLKEEV